LSRVLTVAAVLSFAVTAFPTAATAAPSPGDPVLCDQYASQPIQGGAYIVQNNRWGTTATQCISVSATGFTITRQDGVNATNGAPTAYPSVYWGCHYGNCTTGFDPVPVSSSEFAELRTSARSTHTTSRVVRAHRREVTVRSTGTAPTRGWQVSWTRPSGQTVVNTWNAAPGSSGSTQTATSLSYNGALAPASTTTFGYQGSGKAGASGLTCRAS
jgi:hypothetical protein